MYGGDVDDVAPLAPADHVLHRLLGQAEHADDVHHEGPLKPVPSTEGRASSLEAMRGTFITYD